MSQRAYELVKRFYGTEPRRVRQEPPPPPKPPPDPDPVSGLSLWEFREEWDQREEERERRERLERGE